MCKMMRTGPTEKSSAIAVDEFTSALDRTSAKEACEGLAQLLKTASELEGRLVVAGLHLDVLDWLWGRPIRGTLLNMVRQEGG